MATTKKKTSSSRTGSGTGADESVHDDFYRSLRAKIANWADRKELDSSYRDYILLVPDLFHFLTMLVMEPKVATRDKAWLGVAVAYVLSPIDFIPDMLFPLGLVDDLIVMVIVLDTVLGRIPRSLVKKHWAGSADIFDVVQDSLQKADDWVGKGMFRRLKSYLAKQGLWKEEAATPPPVPKARATSRKKTASSGTAKARSKTTRKTTRKAAKKKTTTTGRTAGGKKKTSKRTVSAKKRTTKKKTTSKRTIGAKKKGGSGK